MQTHTIIPTPRPGILFMPDISGFTRFVNETAISHSQHIIAELLEVMIQATGNAFEVSEIEGDAILFFRLEEQPVLHELEELVHHIYISFHQHLKYYQRDLICHCGACSSVSNLSLKFILHYGQLSTLSVGDRIKLAGRDVIAVHRFLKNSVPLKEYILISSELAQSSKALPEELRGYIPLKENFEGLGEISYFYKPLDGWLKSIPEPPPLEHFKLPVIRRMEKTRIKATAEEVLYALTEPSQRLCWMTGLKRITLRKHKINRVKTVHECILGHQQVEVRIEDYAQDGGKIKLIETGTIQVPSLKITTLYQIEPVGDQEAIVGIGVHLTPQHGFLSKLLLPLAKYFMELNSIKNLNNLKKLLEDKQTKAEVACH
ncbi:DUF2652 domain-containing protein [Pontibacter sp. FD36]|uniref:DUF2652 domain-containing protein n=1 Tax=Pontibacter sp. FD36 TaxID=2789860 RepID=UPI0018A9FACB|nr:DUF2652 domain-containing protein [Pontibacter sp. FD36]MBF8965497.1 DUF2652 domain-containing protein [Pontibacter sp. FD36]